MKVYVFDDDVVLSGANMSDSYFVDRHDRYVVFKNHPELARYFCELTDVVGKASYKLSADAKLSMTVSDFPDPADQPGKFEKRANALFSDFLDKEVALSDPFRKQIETGQANPDTLILPLVQVGPIKIQQDEKFTLDFLRTFSQPSDTFYFASGYFNFTPHYMQKILESKALFKILTASPKSNGFYGSNGVSFYIPPGYTCIERDFMLEAEKNQRGKEIQIYEYEKPGWTFHAKGMWYSAQPNQPPSMTMIGSPNYGHRSVKHDVEAQVLLHTKNEQLMEKMKLERDQLFKLSKHVSLSDLDTEDRRTGMGVRFFTWLLKGHF